MPPALVASPLDLCRPPEGFEFRSGVWLAHDVDMAMVADTVAPILAGTPDPDPQRRRRLAATPTGDPELVVLGCAARLGQVTAFPWAVFVPVGGRVQHAKGGVLQFARPNSPKRITRAFVTSANLTRGSLANREVLVWEEAGSQKANPTLAHDLLAAVQALSADLPTEARRRIRALVRQLAQGLPASTPARCTVDSLAVKRPLLAQVEGQRPAGADRLVIVSPPFAGDNDRQAADYLLPWIRQGTQVDLYTGEAMPGATLGPERRPAFSIAILTALATASGAPVQVWGVPNYDADGRRRRLHAKLIAFVRGEDAMVVAGSANCTGRGLGGINRELMAYQDWSRQRLDAWLAELSASPFDGQVAAPAPREDPADVPNVLIDVGASFQPDPGQRVVRGRFRGVLRLRLPDEHAALHLAYRGKALRAEPEQELELWETEAWLTASVNRSHRRVPIEMAAIDAGFWDAGNDDDDDEDATLLALLRALRPGPAGTPVARRGRSGAVDEKGRSPDDKFTIETQQALALLTRRRAQLRYRFVDGAGLALENLFADKIERRVADTVLGNPPPDGTPLLTALAEAIDAFEPPDE